MANLIERDVTLPLEPALGVIRRQAVPPDNECDQVFLIAA